MNRRRNAKPTVCSRDLTVERVMRKYPQNGVETRNGGDVPSA